MYEIEIAYTGAARPMLEREIIKIVGREPDGTLREPAEDDRYEPSNELCRGADRRDARRPRPVGQRHHR